jgi:hypothetical protein
MTHVNESEDVSKPSADIGESNTGPKPILSKMDQGGQAARRSNLGDPNSAPDDVAVTMGVGESSLQCMTRSHRSFKLSWASSAWVFPRHHLSHPPPLVFMSLLPQPTSACRARFPPSAHSVLPLQLRNPSTSLLHPTSSILLLLFLPLSLSLLLVLQPSPFLLSSSPSGPPFPSTVAIYSRARIRGAGSHPRPEVWSLWQ